MHIKFDVMSYQSKYIFKNSSLSRGKNITEQFLETEDIVGLAVMIGCKNISFEDICYMFYIFIAALFCCSYSAVIKVLVRLPLHTHEHNMNGIPVLIC